MNKDFSHITFVVDDVDETLGAYEQLLAIDPSSGIKQDLEDARLATIHLGPIRLEFIEPDPSADSLFAEFLEERGEGVISYCLVIDDFDAEIERLKERGAALEEATQPDIFPDHTLRLAWVLPEERLGCRVELVDRESLPPEERSVVESA